MARHGVAENVGFCRSMASMVWRKMAENVGFCHSVADMAWRIMADFVERISPYSPLPKSQNLDTMIGLC